MILGQIRAIFTTPLKNAKNRAITEIMTFFIIRFCRFVSLARQVLIVLRKDKTTILFIFLL